MAKETRSLRDKNNITFFRLSLSVRFLLFWSLLYLISKTHLEKGKKSARGWRGYRSITEAYGWQLGGRSKTLGSLMPSVMFWKFCTTRRHTETTKQSQHAHHVKWRVQWRQALNNTVILESVLFFFFTSRVGGGGMGWRRGTHSNTCTHVHTRFRHSPFTTNNPLKTPARRPHTKSILNFKTKQKNKKGVGGGGGGW